MGQSTANLRANQLEHRFAVPVMLAALLSVPAVPLALWGTHWWSQLGSVVNTIAGVVLWAEWILLIVLADNRLEWLRRHKWSTLVVALTIPAVIFTIGPAQALRLVRVIATLRLVRLTRIVEAGSVLGRRLALTSTARSVLLAASGLLAAALAGLVLADPDSDSRRLLTSAAERMDVSWPVLLCGGLLLAAVAVAGYRWFRRHRPAPPTEATENSDTDQR